MQQGLHAWQTIVGGLSQPWFLGAVAEAYGNLGQSDQGLEVLGTALALVDTNEEHVWEAELYRRQGELYLQQIVPDRSPAERCFRRALTIAQQQHAKSWELRAAMSLSRLWHRQGQQQAALRLLQEVYHWFTEGFETQDVRTARALLQEFTS
jgi:predicted ATPase